MSIEVPFEQYQPQYLGLRWIDLPERRSELQSLRNNEFLSGLVRPFDMQALYACLQQSGSRYYVYSREHIDDTIMQIKLHHVNEYDVAHLKPQAYIFEGIREVVGVDINANVNFTTECINGWVYIIDYLGIGAGFQFDPRGEARSTALIGNRNYRISKNEFLRPYDSNSNGDALKVEIRIMQPADNVIRTKRSLQKFIGLIEQQPITSIANNYANSGSNRFL